MNRRKWIRAAGLLLVLSLVLWRLVPRSIFTIAGTDKEAIHRIYVSVHTNTAEAVPVYQVNTEELEEARLGELLEILEGKGFRPSFWNLLFFGPRGHGVMGESKSASIVLVWDRESEKACHLTFLGSQASGTHMNFGSKVYYPVEEEILAKLAEYAAAYGTVSG